MIAGTLIRLRRGRGRTMLAMAGGLAVAVALLAARNTAVGAPPLALAGSGPLTFVASNDPAYEPFDGFNFDEGWLAGILGTTDGRSLPAVSETLRRQTLGSLAAVLWGKFSAAWHWYEVPNIVNFYYMRLQAPVLAWLPVTAFVISPLGMVGLLVGARRLRTAWPLYSLVLCHVTALTLFLVLGRLRVALLAALVPFAALAIVELVRAPWRTRAAIIVAVTALGAWTSRALPADRPLIAADDWLLPFHSEYEARVRQALDTNDRAGAVAAYSEFLAFEPPFATMEVANGVLGRVADREAARSFAAAHAVCAELLRGGGEEQRAAVEQAKADALLHLAGER